MAELLKYKGFEGSAEVDVERNVCRGKLLFVDDLVTYEAGTPADLQVEFQAAVDDYLDTCRQLGREPKKPFSGVFNVRVRPELHEQAARRAAREYRSLNAVVVDALAHYLGEPDRAGAAAGLANYEYVLPPFSFTTNGDHARIQPTMSGAFVSLAVEVEQEH